MRLSDLIATDDLEPALRGLEIAGLSADSRAVGDGYAFFAIPGHAGDGLNYLADAAARGARVVVAQHRADCPLPLVVVDDVRAALAHAAARFYPRQPETIVAVTGTSGKTSVVAFVRQIWAALGHEAASLGTVGVVDSSGAQYGALTTPGPVELHKTLDELAARGVTHLAVEASSLGIEQRRLDGVRIAVAGFTNFSRDHLDHHPDMESYFAAKMRLFDTLMQAGQTAVIDADSDVAARVIDVCKKRGLKIFDVGAKGASLRLQYCEPETIGTAIRVFHQPYEAISMILPLPGAFQVSNALVAAGLAIASGDDPKRVLSALIDLKGAPGRLERIGERAGAPVFVDYAHKPDALEKVLATLRPLTQQRLVVVFGCGGDRDKGKRPLMGEIAARAADVAIITDDNPRSEEPASIRAEILAGARGAGAARIIEIPDRGAAISQAIADLRSGDVLVVAGKGHETGQIVGDRVLPFSDHDAIRQALQEHRA